MRKIERLPLDSTVLQRLDELARLVAVAGDPRAAAARLWRTLPDLVRRAMFDTLVAMSTGIQRCMYCEDSQGTDIEHFRPRSAYPEYTFAWLNHLLACSHCNSNAKRERFPEDADGEPLLINPAQDDPSRHLTLSPTTGLFVGSDAKGRTSIDVYGLNRDVCAQGRRDAWTTLGVLMLHYAREMRGGRIEKARRILEVVRRHSFQSVRVHMVEIVRRADEPTLILDAEVVAAVADFPELTDTATG